MAGVVFTRNPIGGREMVIEYSSGIGEQIVSGEIVPEKNQLYWNNDLPKDAPKEFNRSSIISKFKKIESSFDFPQDIEWCICDNKFYILQTRPITTISDTQYEQILYLEKFLAKRNCFYFEKTEISEIAPRPTSFTFSLLKKLYEKDGPIDKVYRELGVKYQYNSFLKIIGNELYVDSEKELCGLLPAYTHFSDDEFVPKLKIKSGLLRSLKNIIKLNTISTKPFEELFVDLKKLIEDQDVCTELDKSLKKFILDYELVFKVNLLSGLSIKRLEVMLKREAIEVADVIDSANLFVDLSKYKISAPTNVLGNSLDISDETKFVAGLNDKSIENKDVKKWWTEQPNSKKQLYARKLKEAAIYSRLREYGRWLTVKTISQVRSILHELAKQNSFNEKENIYFTKIDELSRGEVKESTCLDRKHEYDQYSKFTLPSRLTSLIVKSDNKLLGVSSGTAQGKIMTGDQIDKSSQNDEKVILYTEILSPDLTQYFDEISGIVSTNGGLLSHLAIVAREKRIPVVVGFSLGENDVKIGDNIEINGGNGKIKIL